MSSPWERLRAALELREEAGRVWRSSAQTDADWAEFLAACRAEIAARNRCAEELASTRSDRLAEGEPERVRPGAWAPKGSSVPLGFAGYLHTGHRPPSRLGEIATTASSHGSSASNPVRIGQLAPHGETHIWPTCAPAELE